MSINIHDISFLRIASHEILPTIQYTTYRVHVDACNTVSMCAIVLHKLMRPDVPHFDGLVRTARDYATAIRVELRAVDGPVDVRLARNKFHHESSIRFSWNCE